MEDMNLGKTGLKVSAMATLVDILHEEGCSCVISAGGQITICRERGIKDLFRILNATPGLLDGAYIADKVIGKGAAALMVLGKVKEVYADDSPSTSSSGNNTILNNTKAVKLQGFTAFVFDERECLT